MNIKTKKIIRMAIMAMLTAVSVVLIYVIRIPLIPSAPFLEYDPADIPMLIAGALLGPAEGITVVFLASLIQAFTVSAASGWIGFLMHFISSGALVLIVSLIYKKISSVKGLVIGLVAGSVVMIALMIPLNFIFTGIFLNVGTKAVAQMIMPAILPFNALKAAINSVITFAIFIPCSKAIKKFI
ncbi:MAG: ECF transporter S component [Clostridia bacterium]|nr:ECF transporter S component [Clostridia bacterium]